ncbi:hypothetical protein SAMN05216379_12232 [Nitrosomonas eutropha]|uniref:hypothetical protein n=1 Tax=Nitrosomonas eutropha TaxID=916 RepID=UPI00088E2B0E|nr:hypothetical protein [Nitrosomonas eutropha]SCX23993.1 hypothetical protein SAMN05216379_12232 [Nitrosomonas eutropha]
MRWLIKRHDRLLWVLGMLIVFPGTSFSEASFNRPSLHSRQSQILPAIWMGGGLSYFPFYIQPLLLYPEIPGLYPCFPFGSCMVLQPYRKYERREKQRPVFKRGAPLADDAMEIWRAGLRPAVEPFRTDEQLIMPAFRGHSLIRPEYQKAGSILPEFSADERNENDENEWPDEQ